MSNFMKISLLLVFLLTKLSFATDLKIGFVNMDSAVSGQLEAQKHLRELETDEQKIGDDEQKARVSIEAEMLKLQEGSSKMTQQARAAEENKLRDKISKLQEDFAKRRMSLAEKKQKVLLDLESKNRLLIESIARKNKLPMVINSAAVLYMNDEMKKNDITQTLIGEYNKAYPVAPAVKKTPAAPAKGAKK